MRITKEAAAANKARVLKAASKLLRERGVEGLGVAEVMREAGLTHGGFYNHFDSKDDLAAAAVRDAFEAACARLQQRAVDSQTAREKAGALAQYVERYLSTETRDAPGQSCPMASLGTDAARSGAAIREAFASGVDAYLKSFSELMPSGQDGRSAARADAIVTISTLIGALTLARACAGSDEELSREILDVVRTQLAGSTT